MTGDRGRGTGDDSMTRSSVSRLPSVGGRRLPSAVSEQPSIRFHPLTQRLDPVGDGCLRAPAQVPPCFADVGDIHLLVPGSPIAEGQSDGFVLPSLQAVDELQQGRHVLRAAADVVCLAAASLDSFDGPVGDIEQIVDEEDVADLTTVAVDRDRPAQERGNYEMGYPTLILDAELTPAVDARLAEDHRPQAKDP